MNLKLTYNSEELQVTNSKDTYLLFTNTDLSELYTKAFTLVNQTEETIIINDIIFSEGDVVELITDVSDLTLLPTEEVDLVFKVLKTGSSLVTIKTSSLDFNFNIKSKLDDESHPISLLDSSLPSKILNSVDDPSSVENEIYVSKGKVNYDLALINNKSHQLFVKEVRFNNQLLNSYSNSYIDTFSTFDITKSESDIEPLIYTLDTLIITLDLSSIKTDLDSALTVNTALDITLTIDDQDTTISYPLNIKYVTPSLEIYYEDSLVEDVINLGNLSPYREYLRYIVISNSNDFVPLYIQEIDSTDTKLEVNLDLPLVIYPNQSYRVPITINGNNTIGLLNNSLEFLSNASPENVSLILKADFLYPSLKVSLVESEDDISVFNKLLGHDENLFFELALTNIGEVKIDFPPDSLYLQDNSDDFILDLSKVKSVLLPGEKNIVGILLNKRVRGSYTNTLKFSSSQGIDKDIPIFFRVLGPIVELKSNNKLIHSEFNWNENLEPEEFLSLLSTREFELWNRGDYVLRLKDIPYINNSSFYIKKNVGDLTIQPNSKLNFTLSISEYGSLSSDLIIPLYYEEDKVISLSANVPLSSLGLKINDEEILLDSSSIPLDIGQLKLYEDKDNELILFNRGDHNLNLSSLGFVTDDFYLLGSLPPFLLPNTESDPIKVRANTSSLGYKQATLVIDSNDETHKKLNLTFSAEVKSLVPKLEVKLENQVKVPEYTVINPTISINESYSTTFLLSNKGEGSLTLSSIYLDPPYTLQSSKPSVISSNNPIKIGISTNVPGLYKSRLTFITNDPNNPSYTLWLETEVTEAPKANLVFRSIEGEQSNLVKEESLTLNGIYRNTSSSINVVLRNNGNKETLLNSIQNIHDKNEVTALGLTLPKVIKPYSDLSINLNVISSQESGDIMDEIRFITSDNNKDLSLKLNTHIISPKIRLETLGGEVIPDGDEVWLSNVTLSDLNSVSRKFKLRNIGNHQLTIESLHLIGSQLFSYHLEDEVIEKEGETFLDIRFDPTQLTLNELNWEYHLMISIIPLEYEDVYTFNVKANILTPSLSIKEVSTNTIIEDKLSLPDSEINSYSRTYLELSNKGNDLLVLDKISFTPNLRVNKSLPLVISPNERILIQIIADSLEVGPQQGLLSFQTNDPTLTNRELEINYKVFGPILEVIINNSNLESGDELFLGDDIPKNSESELNNLDIILRNKGTSSLDISSIKLDPPFFINQGVTSIPALSSKVLKLRLDTSNAGINLSNLDIEYNNQIKSPYSISLKGIVKDLNQVNLKLKYEGNLVSSGSVISLGSYNYSSSLNNQNVIYLELFNESINNLHIDRIDIQSDLIHLSDYPETIGPNKSHLLRLEVDTSLKGSFRESLNIVSNALISNYRLNLDFEVLYSSLDVYYKQAIVNQDIPINLGKLSSKDLPFKLDLRLLNSGTAPLAIDRVIVDDKVLSSLVTANSFFISSLSTEILSLTINKSSLIGIKSNTVTIITERKSYKIDITWEETKSNLTLEYDRSGNLIDLGNVVEGDKREYKVSLINKGNEISLINKVVTPNWLIVKGLSSYSVPPNSGKVDLYLESNITSNILNSALPNKDDTQSSWDLIDNIIVHSEDETLFEQVVLHYRSISFSVYTEDLKVEENDIIYKSVNVGNDVIYLSIPFSINSTGYEPLKIYSIDIGNKSSFSLEGIPSDIINQPIEGDLSFMIKPKKGLEDGNYICPISIETNDVDNRTFNFNLDLNIVPQARPISHLLYKAKDLNTSQLLDTEISLLEKEYADINFSIVNSGTAPLNINEITLEGNSANLFNKAFPSFIKEEGGKYDFTIRLKGISKGYKTNVLNVKTSDKDYSIHIQHNVLNASIKLFDWDNNSLDLNDPLLNIDLGFIYPDQPRTYNLSLENDGLVPIESINIDQNVYSSDENNPNLVAYPLIENETDNNLDIKEDYGFFIKSFRGAKGKITGKLRINIGDPISKVYEIPVQAQFEEPAAKITIRLESGEIYELLSTSLNEINLGSIKEDKEFIVNIHNVGSSNLILKELKRDRTLVLESDYNSILPPGKDLDIRIKVFNPNNPNVLNLDAFLGLWFNNIENSNFAVRFYAEFLVGDYSIRQSDTNNQDLGLISNNTLINFVEDNIEEQDIKYLEVTNTGDIDLRLSGLSLAEPFFRITKLPVDLPPQTSYLIAIGFKPFIYGNFSQRVSININDDLISFNLVGKAESSELIINSIFPNHHLRQRDGNIVEIDLGSLVKQENYEVHLEFHNEGNKALTLSSIFPYQQHNQIPLVITPFNREIITFNIEDLNSSVNKERFEILLDNKETKFLDFIYNVISPELELVYKGNIINSDALTLNSIQEGRTQVDSIFIRNKGTKSLSISLINYSSNIEILSLPIKEGESPIKEIDPSRQFELGFKYRGYRAGLNQGFIEIKNNFDNSLYRINIEFKVLGAVYKLDTHELDFKEVNVNHYKEDILSITNEGNSILRLRRKTELKDIIPLFSDTVSILPNHTQELKFRFEPKEIGDYTQDLIFETNDSLNPLLTIGIKAKGVAPIIHIYHVNESLNSSTSSQVNRKSPNSVIHLGDINTNQKVQTVLKVSNMGNSEGKLNIINKPKWLELEGPLEIEPYSQSDIYISSNTNLHGDYKEDLILKTNSNPIQTFNIPISLKVSAPDLRMYKEGIELNSNSTIDLGIVEVGSNKFIDIQVINKGETSFFPSIENLEEEVHVFTNWDSLASLKPGEVFNLKFSLDTTKEISNLNETFIIGSSFDHEGNVTQTNRLTIKASILRPELAVYWLDDNTFTHPLENKVLLGDIPFNSLNGHSLDLLIRNEKAVNYNLRNITFRGSTIPEEIPSVLKQEESLVIRLPLKALYLGSHSLELKINNLSNLNSQSKIVNFELRVIKPILEIDRYHVNIDNAKINSLIDTNLTLRNVGVGNLTIDKLNYDSFKLKGLENIEFPITLTTGSFIYLPTKVYTGWEDDKILTTTLEVISNDNDNPIQKVLIEGYVDYEPKGKLNIALVNEVIPFNSIPELDKQVKEGSITSDEVRLSKVLDLGFTYKDIPLTSSFKLLNEGDKEVNIGAIISTNEAVIIQDYVPSILLPGEEVELRVTLFSNNDIGRFKSLIQVENDSFDNPYSIEVKSDIRSRPINSNKSKTYYLINESELRQVDWTPLEVDFSQVKINPANVKLRVTQSRNLIPYFVEYDQNDRYKRLWVKANTGLVEVSFDNPFEPTKNIFKDLTHTFIDFSREGSDEGEMMRGLKSHTSLINGNIYYKGTHIDIGEGSQIYLTGALHDIEEGIDKESDPKYLLFVLSLNKCEGSILSIDRRINLEYEDEEYSCKLKVQENEFDDRIGGPMFSNKIHLLKVKLERHKTSFYIDNDPDPILETAVTTFMTDVVHSIEIGGEKAIVSLYALALAKTKNINRLEEYLLSKYNILEDVKVEKI